MTKETLALQIAGIDCSGCARNFELNLMKNDGIIDARIKIGYETLYIDFNPEEITRDEIIKIILTYGYKVEDLKKVHELKESRAVEMKRKVHFKLLLRKTDFYTTVLSGVFLSVGLFLEFIFQLDLAAFIIFIIGTIIGGLFIFKKAFFSLLHLNLDINLLMTIAAISAIIIREAFEANSIVFLFSLAEIAESLSIARAKGSIENLINLAPNKANVLIENEEISIPANQVEINSIIIVKPGERIPLDGIIVDGESFINQAPITGESEPIVKGKDNEVFAGTLNLDSILKIKITKPYEEIYLKKIIALVEGSDQRAPIERYVDIFSKYYTPIMFLIASLTLLIPPLITGDPFIYWVYIALVILVISCPCAVVLSTPISIVAALNRAAQNGVLIKGGSFLESISKTKVFAFDKTGTLTEGKPTVSNVITDSSITENDLLQIAGSLEYNSNHPVASAIKEKMDSEKLSLLPVTNFKSIAGMGIKGNVNQENWIIGNPRIIIDENLKITDELASTISFLQAERKTVVILSKSEKVIGIISVNDQMKPHAKGFVCELQSLGAEKIIMLTGDNSKTAAQIASELNINDFKAELLPEQKLMEIKNLNNEFGNVAMIGDGINDAPALTTANIGIAMGTSGSDVALEAADIVLMTDSMDSLHYLITLSKKVMRIIKMNITIAILIKLVLFVLSYFGLVSLWLAVLIGDMGVSLFVIFNAILSVKGKKMSHSFCDKEICPIVNPKNTSLQSEKCQEKSYQKC